MTALVHTPTPITTEPKWTCDRDGNWTQIAHVRFREVNGNLNDAPVSEFGNRFKPTQIKTQQGVKL